MNGKHPAQTPHSTAIGAIRRLFLLNKSEEARITTNYIRDLEISPAAATKFVNLLSGGNQQKIVVAREMSRDFKVLLAAQPSKKFATVDELGALAVFLCSDGGQSITGTALPVDGGWTAQ